MFLPVRMRMELEWIGKPADAFRFRFSVFGFALLTFPDRKSRRARWLARKLAAGIERLLDFSAPPREAKPEPAKSDRKRPGLDFAVWALRRGYALVSGVTRRMELRCGGVDPALLGTLTGVVAVLRGATGVRKLVWVPDFAPGPARVALDWRLSASVWRLVQWVGDSYFDRNRRRRDF